MDDTEAEAVLVVLGPVLEWQCFDLAGDSVPGHLYCRAHRSTGDALWDHWDYGIEFDPRSSRQVRTAASCLRSSVGGVDINEPMLEEELQYWYNTIAEAKAACEIHARTGQFPPGVEKE